MLLHSLVHDMHSAIRWNPQVLCHGYQGPLTLTNLSASSVLSEA